MQRVSVGRQPIFDRSLGVLGYELLYRASSEAHSATDTGDMATAQVIVSTYTELGVERLVADRLTFLNVTRNFVTGAMPLPVPPGGVVLELLPTIGADDEVRAGAERLRAQGFRIALDDYTTGDPRETLLPVCDLVKIDITRTPPAELSALVKQVQQTPVRLSAMRVEGLEDMSRGMELGFDFFQGYHLVRPDVVTAQVVTPSQRVCADLLAALHAGERDVEALLRTDVALTYRLLRALAATAGGPDTGVTSVREAIEILGRDRLRAWLQLLMVAESNRPSEGQLSAALTRARACELLAQAHPVVPAGAAFLAGLVSGLDAVLDAPTPEIVDRLPLAPGIREAVLSGAGELGAILTAMRAQERDETQELTLGGTEIDPFELSRVHLEAMGWSLQVCEGEPGPMEDSGVSLTS